MNLKVYIQQATGHKIFNSLENYIDIELTDTIKVVYNLLEGKNIEAIEKEKQKLLTMLKNKEISTIEYIKQMEVML